MDEERSPPEEGTGNAAHIEELIEQIDRTLQLQRDVASSASQATEGVVFTSSGNASSCDDKIADESFYKNSEETDQPRNLPQEPSSSSSCNALPIELNLSGDREVLWTQKTDTGNCQRSDKETASTNDYDSKLNSSKENDFPISSNQEKTTMHKNTNRNISEISESEDNSANDGLAIAVDEDRPSNNTENIEFKLVEPIAKNRRQDAGHQYQVFEGDDACSHEYLREESEEKQENRSYSQIVVKEEELSNTREDTEHMEKTHLDNVPIPETVIEGPINTEEHASNNNSMTDDIEERSQDHVDRLQTVENDMLPHYQDETDHNVDVPTENNGRVEFELEHPFVEEGDVSSNEVYPVVEASNVSNNEDYPVVEEDNVSNNEEYPVLEEDNVSNNEEYPVVEEGNASNNEEYPVVEEDNVSINEEYPVVEEDNVSDNEEYPVVEAGDVSNNASPNEVSEESAEGRVERPLVLRRQTSFQRELADAIVRLAPMEELELLLRCGAKVSEPVTQGLTPLHYAVWQRYPEAAQLLIREGCDLNARDDIGYTPLHLCAEHGYLDMMQLLLEHNAKINFNEPEDEDLYPIDAIDEPLRLALKHDQMKAARVLLENNANPNGRYFFGSEINLVSPLNTELLELLLKWGARPNTRDRYGFTPIMKACHVQQEAEEALEEQGTISGKDVLLHFAQTLKGIESVLVLISHGADINLRTDARHEYRSVLHYAILSGSSPIVNLLLKQGATVNFEPEYNRASPLHLAVLKGDINIINMLLDNEAIINITTPSVGSPLHVACSEQIPNRLQVLQLLLDRGADPNVVVRSNSGRPLKPALGEYLANNVEHDIGVIKLLLRYGTQVIMQSPQQCPLGLLNCLYTVAKNREVMIELLEAAERFDIPLIRKTPLLVPSSHRDLFLEVASNPLSLRHMARVLVRQIMKKRCPEAIEDLSLPRLLKEYLLYDIN